MWGSSVAQPANPRDQVQYLGVAADTPGGLGESLVVGRRRGEERAVGACSGDCLMPVVVGTEEWV